MDDVAVAAASGKMRTRLLSNDGDIHRGIREASSQQPANHHRTAILASKQQRRKPLRGALARPEQ